MSHARLALVSPTPTVRVVHDTNAPFYLSFDRWHSPGSRRGYWQGLPPKHPHPMTVWLEAPRLDDWTAATVDEVIAIARAELAARGAVGPLRITATPGEDFFVCAVTLEVRVGNLRAHLWLRARVVHYELPQPILRALANRVTRTTKALTVALERQRLAALSTW